MGTVVVTRPALEDGDRLAGDRPIVGGVQKGGVVIGRPLLLVSDVTAEVTEERLVARVIRMRPVDRLVVGDVLEVSVVRGGVLELVITTIGLTGVVTAARGDSRSEATDRPSA